MEDNISKDRSFSVSAALPGRQDVSLNYRNVLFLVSSLSLIAFQWQPIVDLIRYAWDFDHTNASQVLIIPFVSAFLFFLNRGKIFASIRYDVVPGVLIASLGIGLRALGYVWGMPGNPGDRLALTTASILAVWFGLYVVFYGVASFKMALFPLLFLLFCLPIPKVILDALIHILQRGSAEITYVLLKLSGTPVYREGFLFSMPTLNIEIAKECSGIRSFLSMLILSILAGHLLLETTWRRIALVLIAIPIMIFKNAVRITTLSLLSIHVDPRIITSRLHQEGGIPFFLVALVLTYPFLKLLMNAERRKSPASSSLREANL